MCVRCRRGHRFVLAALWGVLSLTITGRGNSFEVEVSSPTVIVVKEQMALQKRCRVDRKIIGCTWFTDERLECRCDRDEERWRITPRASLAPVMLVLSDGWQIRRHEMVHVLDVARRLREHMKSIAEMRFESQDECESAAAAAADPASFVQLMNGFRRESNEKYQCAKPSR